MKAYNTIVKMGTRNSWTYISPDVEESSINNDVVLCVSGNHEGITEEDWIE